MDPSVLWNNYGIRAMRAYFRTGGTYQPSMSMSGAEEVDDKDYVVLRDTNGVLAVYRVTPRETLRRLRRWPSAIA